jgi:hypothetical protein
LIASGAITGSSIVSNSSINGATLQTTGTATVNALVSNGSITGTTLQTSGAAIVNSLASNGAVSGSSLSTTGAINGGTLQTSGTATVNALVSNTSITAASFNTGTSQVSGTETVNALIANTTITANNVTVGSGGLSVSGPVVGNGYTDTGNTFTTSSGAVVTVDSWLTNQFRTVQYIAQVTDNTSGSNLFYSTQFMIIHDGPSNPATYIATNVFKTEYNIMYSGGAQNVGSFDATLTGGGTVVSVTFTPSSATNKTIRVARTCLPV